ncbi:MAG: polysaccharide biosynthesis/export family protein [Planctomycetes bacterium]|nr:polysaccharide biosynthesis/export family protein [Planctomycetota bacterium]MDA0948854.1 polysaccharide biosynthesis/export family protein [Planctomycetota bacterium]
MPIRPARVLASAHRPVRASWGLGTLLLLCLASWVTGCNSSSAPDKRVLQYLNRDGFGNRYTGNAEEENYVSIGDTVALIDVLKPGRLSSTQVVDIDGTVLLPELGVVHVAGYTRSDLRAYLTERYSAYYDETQLEVQIKTQGKKYFVFGEVYSEGEVQFEGDLTIFEAVMGAEPRPNSANLGRVKLIRADPVDPFVAVVNINDLFDGDSTFNLHVHERDIIFVPPTMLAQVAYFIKALIFPFTEVIREVSSAFFWGSRFGLFDTNLQAGGRNNGLFF